MKNLFTYLFLLILFVFSSRLHSQTILGKVTSSRFPVKNAMVTFIYSADTTKKYTGLTDDLGNYQIGLISSIRTGSDNLPTDFELGQSYPNPFNNETAIPYGLNKESHVQIVIYDILGRVIRKFDVGQQAVGYHNILWDGHNDFGRRVATGVYFYQMTVNGVAQVRKMILGSSSTAVLPNISPIAIHKLDKVENQYLQGGSYTVRIENTNETDPFVVPQQFENIDIQNDTTINFSVSTIPLTTINLDSLYQYIRGFGAANIVGWRPDMTDSEIETAFGTGDGQLGFSILRLRIAPSSNDWSASMPTAKKAYDMGVTIMASPWTPPSAMKTNNSSVSGELKESSYADYAAHLKAFGDYMASNDVPIYTISIQNEPDASVSYESCDWNSTQFLNFCKNNAQDIGYRVMMPESQNFVHALSDPTLNDSVAASNVSIIAGHIYGGGLYPYPLAESKGKEVWMTEHLTESAHSANVWSLALEVGVEMQLVMQSNMSAYIWWYIVRYYGPIADGDVSTTFPDEDFGAKGEVTKKGYVMSQFARFIRPGFYRVSGSTSPPLSNVSVSVYKDPASSKVVIVAINTSGNPVTSAFRIKDTSVSVIVTPYTTTESKNCEKGNSFDLLEGNFTYTLEASSVTTFVTE